MPVRIEHLIDVAIDDSPTSQAATFDFQGVTPRWVTLYVQVVESGSGATVTLTVEVSPDDGQTLIDYDKLLTDAGTDAPVSSVVYSATGDDIVSLSPEDVLDYIKVTMTGGSTTAGNFYDVDVWMAYAY
jgi:hypothetical protein